MNRTRLDPAARLEESLRRMRGAMDFNRNQYASMAEQVMTAAGAEAVERVTERLAERHQRRMERWERRRERRAERWAERRRDLPVYEPADSARGVVSIVAAVACLAIAVLNPGLWWLVFVALGLATSGVSRFGRAARRRRAREVEEEAEAEESAGGQAEARAAAQTSGQAEARAPVATSAPAEPSAPVAAQPPAAPAEPPDPRVTRIQSLCDKLLAELESGPPIVREVVTQPRETIGGLRQACLEIARRERELRTVLEAQKEETLIADRDALVTRLSNERDDIVRDRLGQALRALEEQLAHRAELSTAADRLDAENTRILYTLESLQMQLLRARSTDMGGPELGAKLRSSLGELGTQIDAVAEALEWASAPAGADRGVAAPAASDAGPAAADSKAPVADAKTAPADADLAEKRDAARRAAQAQQAQQAQRR